MKSSSILAIIAAGILSVSCTLHPIPEGDLTGADTLQIVEKIRCETRDAAISVYWNRLYPNKKYSDKQINWKSDSQRYESYRVSTEAKASRLREYESITIIYNFTFDITSHSKNGILVNFINPFSNGTRSMGVGGSALRQNQNQRTFRISETINDLFKLAFCPLTQPAQGSKLYPITGQIGIAEVVRTFLSLNDVAAIVDKEGKPKPTLVETMTFLTVLSGSLSPKITLQPITSGISISEASVTNDIIRTDQHELILSLALPDVKERKITNIGNARKQASDALNKQQELNSQSRPSSRERLILQELLNRY